MEEFGNQDVGDARKRKGNESLARFLWCGAMLSLNAEGRSLVLL